MCIRDRVQRPADSLSCGLGKLEAGRAARVDQNGDAALVAGDLLGIGLGELDLDGVGHAWSSYLLGQKPIANAPPLPEPHLSLIKVKQSTKDPMPRIDRYILSQMLTLFGFFALVLVSVYWINRAVSLFEQLMSDGQTALVVLEFTALTLPVVISVVLPVAASNSASGFSSLSVA